jgi:hypothetical protein
MRLPSGDRQNACMSLSHFPRGASAILRCLGACAAEPVGLREVLGGEQ